MELSAGENPFRVERLHGIRYWEPGLGPEVLVDRAEAMGWRGALVGKHGTGKTTLLLEIGAELARRGLPSQYVCVGDEAHAERSLAPVPGTIYLVDGVERLSPTGWFVFRWRMRSARGLIITAHHPGRLPILHLCRPTTETVAHLLRALDPPGLDALLVRAPRLLADYKGDCRAILLALYDEFAGRSTRGV